MAGPTPEGAEPFVDAHVHFWNHAVEGLEWAWLKPGFNHPRLREMHRLDASRFGPEELRAEAGSAAPVKIVHVQCAGLTPSPDSETAWLERVGTAEGWPNAIVGPCRLRERDAGAAIAAQVRHSRFRGVRDMSIVAEVSPAEVAGALDVAVEHDVSLELLLPWEHFGLVRDLAERWPELTIVLGHAGQPTERTHAYYERWGRALRALAMAPNVVVKISALASGADPHWSVESIRPWVECCVEAFGADRSMFATNWPIDRLHGRYEDLVAVYRTITAAWPPDDRAALFHRTAERVYRI